jgi:hypothetical protein
MVLRVTLSRRGVPGLCIEAGVADDIEGVGGRVGVKVAFGLGMDNPLCKSDPPPSIA